MHQYELPLTIPEALEDVNYVVFAGGTGGKNVAPGMVESIKELDSGSQVAIMTTTGDKGSKTGNRRLASEMAENELPLPGIGDIRAIASALSTNGAGALTGIRFSSEASRHDVESINEKLLGYIDSSELSGRVESALYEHTPKILDSIFEYESTQATAQGESSKGLKGYTMGNLALEALFSHHNGDLMAATTDLNAVLKTSAFVMPVTNAAYDLKMEYDGQFYQNEDEIDNLTIQEPEKVTAFWLEATDPMRTDEFTVHSLAKYVVKRSHAIVAPGSFWTTHGGILSVPEMSHALQASKANGNKFDAIANIAKGRDLGGFSFEKYVTDLGGLAGRALDHVVTDDGVDALPEDMVPFKYDGNSKDMPTRVITARLVKNGTSAADANDPLASHRFTKIVTDGSAAVRALVTV